MLLTALMIGLAIQAPAPSSSATKLAVLSECDSTSSVVAEAPRDSALDIHYSIAGAPTCYFVSMTTASGNTVQGFVLDRQAPAIVAFEQARVDTEREAFKMPLLPPPSPAPQAEPVKADAPKTDATIAKAPATDKKSASKPRPGVSM